MNKIRTTVLSVSMILIMIGVILIPSAMGAVGYSASILGGQSTSLTELDATFGDLTPGTTDNEIAGSFTLTNAGNVDAVVSATFTTYASTTYGLTNSTYVIGGANFSMNNTDGGTYTALDNTASATTLTGNNVAADNVADTWNVKLNVPAGQCAAIYTGTVELTFSTV